MKNSEYLTFEELAEILHVSAPTLYARKSLDPYKKRIKRKKMVNRAVLTEVYGLGTCDGGDNMEKIEEEIKKESARSEEVETPEQKMEQKNSADEYIEIKREDYDQLKKENERLKTKEIVYTAMVQYIQDCERNDKETNRDTLLWMSRLGGDMLFYLIKTKTKE